MKIVDVDNFGSQRQGKGRRERESGETSDPGVGGGDISEDVMQQSKGIDGNLVVSQRQRLLHN